MSIGWFWGSKIVKGSVGQLQSNLSFISFILMAALIHFWFHHWETASLLSQAKPSQASHTSKQPFLAFIWIIDIMQAAWRRKFSFSSIMGQPDRPLWKKRLFECVVYFKPMQFPNDSFKALELQNPFHDILEPQKTCQSPYVEAKKLWKGRSGLKIGK